MTRFVFSCLLALAAASSAVADPPTIDRTIGKEPAYKSSPKYALLAFGLEGKDHVWLVLDGDRLFVDRNGNGDLNDPGECVERVKAKNPEDPKRVFSVGKLTLGGRSHDGLRIEFATVARRAEFWTDLSPETKELLAKSPETLVASISIDVEFAGLKGGAEGGRVLCLVGPVDAKGLLVFANRPEDAPVIRLGGPLEIAITDPRISVVRDRDSEVYMVVGSPGIGRGTFAMIGYSETIPESVRVIAELFVDRAGVKTPAQRFELKERC